PRDLLAGGAHLADLAGDAAAYDFVFDDAELRAPCPSPRLHRLRRTLGIHGPRRTRRTHRFAGHAGVDWYAPMAAKGTLVSAPHRGLAHHHPFRESMVRSQL